MVSSTESTAEAPVVEAPAVEAAKPAAVSNSRFSEAERTLRKERVTKAKDALARSVGVKGDHVAPARASLKMYLQRLNEPNQPDDARFELLINGPFTAPPKKKTNDRKFCPVGTYSVSIHALRRMIVRPSISPTLFHA
jgi:hypothetical protein